MSSSGSPNPLARTALVVAALLGVPVLVVAFTLWHSIASRAPAPAAPEAPTVAPQAVSAPAPVVAPSPAPVATPPAAPPAAVSPVPTSGSGLRLTLEGLAADGTVTGRDARTARLVALTVANGTPFSPRLPPGRFRAVFEGALEVDVRDRYEFSCEGSGEVEVQIEGKAVLAGALSEGKPLTAGRARLNKGPNKLSVRYTSPAAGDARLRLLWSSSEFKPEAIAPMRLTAADADAVLHEGQSARRGQAVLDHAQCLACHAPPADWHVARGPDLRGTGVRLEPAWVAAWLRAPQRAGASRRLMPHLLEGAAPADADDISAYLGTLRGDAAPGPMPADAALGGRLFAQLGCIGCHTLPAAAPAADRIALDHVPRKWFPPALTAFLRAPAQVDPGTAMPDFGLSEVEAAALAAYVLASAPQPLPAAHVGDAARGGELVARLGCAACHALPGAAAVPASPWAQVATKVPAVADPCAGAPRYALSADAAGDLQQRARSAWSSLPLGERAEALITELRCTACHARDGVSDVWTAHAGEVAALLPPPDPAHAEVDQTRPALTWAGEKLTTGWINQLLLGQAPARARPWLHARMPAFPAHAIGFGVGFAASHGLAPSVANPTTASAEQLAAGRDLVAAEKGFACVTCHGVGDKPPLQVFEVQGVNFALVAQRLRYDYFLRWMRNPQRVDPSTKMARYADPQGKTGLAQVFGGDAEQQFAAIWAWFESLR